MPEKHREHLPEVIRHKVGQHQKAVKEKRESLFFGMGMFGIVGWTVAIPTVIGTLLGRWLDNLHHGPISWTLTGLLIGMASGCLVAWRWLTKEGGGK